MSPEETCGKSVNTISLTKYAMYRCRIAVTYLPPTPVDECAIKCMAISPSSPSTDSTRFLHNERINAVSVSHID